jgi:hypothetical protein
VFSVFIETRFLLHEGLWKVCGFTLLLRVGNLWRCGDGFFFEVPFVGWRSNRSGASSLRNWKVSMDVPIEIGGTPLEHLSYSSDLAPRDFWAFPTMKRELWAQNRLIHYPPEDCSKWSAAHFWEVGAALWKMRHLPREVLQNETVITPPQSSDLE